MTIRRNQFHFTETLYLCLRSQRGACIVIADSLGKLTERWGRKASGLRDARAYDSGVAGSNVSAPAIGKRRSTDRSSAISTSPSRSSAEVFVPVQDAWTGRNRIR